MRKICSDNRDHLSPRWRKGTDNTVAVVPGYPSASIENVVCSDVGDPTTIGWQRGPEW